MYKFYKPVTNLENFKKIQVMYAPRLKSSKPAKAMLRHFEKIRTTNPACKIERVHLDEKKYNAPYIKIEYDNGGQTVINGKLDNTYPAMMRHLWNDVQGMQNADKVKYWKDGFEGTINSILDTQKKNFDLHVIKQKDKVKHAVKQLTEEKKKELTKEKEYLVSRKKYLEDLRALKIMLSATDQYNAVVEEEGKKEWKEPLEILWEIASPEEEETSLVKRVVR